MAGLQLLLSAPRQALLGTLVGAAVGAAQRSNLLGLRDLRVRTPPPVCYMNGLLCSRRYLAGAHACYGFLVK